MVDVGLDRRRADDETLGDLGVGQSLGDQREYLRLAWRQVVGQFGRGARARRSGRGEGERAVLAGERRHHVVLHGGVERGVARGDGQDRRADVLAAGVLGQIAARARAQRPEHALVVGVGGERDHPHLGMALAQPARRLDPVQPWHAQVHQHDLGLVLVDQRERLLAV